MAIDVDRSFLNSMQSGTFRIIMLITTLIIMLIKADFQTYARYFFKPCNTSKLMRGIFKTL